jgi:hypothetical protein
VLLPLYFGKLNIARPAEYIFVIWTLTGFKICNVFEVLRLKIFPFTSTIKSLFLIGMLLVFVVKNESDSTVPILDGWVIILSFYDVMSVHEDVGWELAGCLWMINRAEEILALSHASMKWGKSRNKLWTVIPRQKIQPAILPISLKFERLLYQEFKPKD